VALRAWPALETERIGGWEVRFAGGFTKRANSVQAVGAPDGTLQDVVARCEDWYAARDRPCVIRLTPLADPSLPEHLGARGYGEVEPSSVLHRPLTEPIPGPDLVEMGADEWSRTYARLRGLDERSCGTLREILDRIEPPLFLGGLPTADAEGPVACGMAVADAGAVGLFDLVTHRSHRGRGYGRRMVEGLLGWGIQRGAQHAYLQVVRANTPAWSLYASMGFVPRFDYRYLVKEPG
jgi:N-acetylglutamate synthase